MKLEILLLPIMADSQPVQLNLTTADPAAAAQEGEGHEAKRFSSSSSSSFFFCKITLSSFFSFQDQVGDWRGER